MNECGVCGILYLAGGSCPACGSQIQKRSEDFQDAEMVLPSEVPGLDEAADAWYELEGIEPPIESQEQDDSSSLPFGYGGESLTNVSRLPFGIGSHRDGIPFEVVQFEATQSSVSEPSIPEPSELETVDEPDNSIQIEDSAEVQNKIEDVPEVPMLPSEEKQPEPKPEPIRIQAIPISNVPAVEVASPDIPLDTNHGQEIFSIDDDVVEVVFSDLEDTIVHVDHGSVDAYSSPQVVEYSEKTFTPFELHPARAMTVEASNDTEIRTLVEDGFMAIGRGDWRSAARSFQRVLASSPQDVGAMNNYGISLLQIATTMQNSSDPVDASNAATQFEAAILSLREAVRAMPEGSEPLYNLVQALYLSGREEKALGLMERVSESNKSTSHFLNLHAAILAQLGQYGEAKNILAPIQGEPLISQNLLKLPSL